MQDLAVFSHSDPQGQVAPHVLYHLDALRAVAHRVVLVTTTPLTTPARESVRGRAELLEPAEPPRCSFSAWRAGLDHVPTWPDCERVIFADDSVVGPLIPYPQIIAAVTAKDPAVWAITERPDAEPALQCYLLGLSTAALRSALVRAFWHGVQPLPGRLAGTRYYELGFSRLVLAAGLPRQVYFVPSRHDRRVAERRQQRRQERALANELGPDEDATPEGPGATSPGRSRPGRLLARFRPAAHDEATSAVSYDPMVLLWDRALQRRLPFVSLAVLAEDLALGRDDRRLRALEKAFPQAFAGVREYLPRLLSPLERPISA